MRTWSSEFIEVDNLQMENHLSREGFLGHIVLFTQFGHELEHTRQGMSQANSIQGEYLAYKTQFTLAEQFDANFGTSIAIDMLIGDGSPAGVRYYDNFADEWYSLGVNLDPSSYEDMSLFRETFFEPDGLYEQTPNFPWPAELQYWFTLGRTAISQLGPIYLP